MENDAKKSPDVQASKEAVASSQEPVAQPTTDVQSTVETVSKKEFEKVLQESIERKKKLQELEDNLKKQQEEELAKNAEWEKLAEERAKEIEALKPHSEKVKEYEEAFASLLEAEKEGVDEDVADAIITNSNYTYSQKLEKLRKLKKPAVPGKSPTTQGSSTSLKNISEEELANMSMEERMKVLL